MLYNIVIFWSSVLIIGPLPDVAADLLDLVNGSLGIAGWLIVICIVVVTADMIFVVIHLILPWSVIFGIAVSSIHDPVFSVLKMQSSCVHIKSTMVVKKHVCAFFSWMPSINNYRLA